MKIAQPHPVRLTRRGRSRRTIPTLRWEGGLSASHAIEVLGRLTARISD